MPELTDRQQLWVTYVEQHFLLEGTLPTAQIIADRTGIPVDKAADMYHNSDCQAFLKAKGLTFDFETDTPLKMLSPRQLALVNSLLDFNERKPDHKKLQALGISPKEYQVWKSDPVFMDYLTKRVDKLLGGNPDEIDRALFDRARDGDINAIKYLNELTGRYRSNEATDINFILVKIQELILKYVKDPEALANIGRELQFISTNRPVVIVEGKKELSNG